MGGRGSSGGGASGGGGGKANTKPALAGGGNTTVHMNGLPVEISTNGKVYGTKQYFNVRAGRQSSQYVYDHSLGHFLKNNNSPVSDAIRNASGLK